MYSANATTGTECASERRASTKHKIGTQCSEIGFSENIMRSENGPERMEQHMPLEKILFPFLSENCPCIACKSSCIFTYNIDIDSSFGSDFLSMYAPDRITRIGEAKINCTYLRRSVQHVKYLEDCPFFDDGIDTD